MEKIIKEYEKQGIIEKCQSSFNSPCLLVSKKDDQGEKLDHRFVVDFRKVNEITEIENFPIPLIDDILDGLGRSKYFTTLDIKGAFHQIMLGEKSRKYTAFTVGSFQYWWIRKPMRLAPAPLTWQRAINIILRELIGRGVYVYLDDVIIYAKTSGKHDLILKRVMELLKEHNLQLKISKCIFYDRKFEYLGHIISPDGIKANPKKVEIVKAYPRPTNVKQVQMFLGLCNYYRRFVRDFARLAKPISSLCKKEQPFIWTNIQQEAFEKLKRALAEEVTLSFPDFEQMFYVTTDASDMAIGGVLSQGELPHDRPIQFYSKTLSET